MEDDRSDKAVRPLLKCTGNTYPSHRHLIDLCLPIVSPSSTIRNGSVSHDVKPDNQSSAPESCLSSTDPKTSQIDANLRLAAEKAQPIRLRRLLLELRYTQPDAHKVTGALLLATQQRYTEMIKASKGTQSDEDKEDEEEEEEVEEEEEEDGDGEDESESDGSRDVGEISELSSEEEEDDEDSDNDSDDDMKRTELGSGEEDDGTDEERASTTTPTRHMPVKSGLPKD